MGLKVSSWLEIQRQKYRLGGTGLLCPPSAGAEIIGAMEKCASGF
jgi:hypothetical protein